MNFNIENVINERLAAGETLDAIASDLTKSLNKAVAVQKEKSKKDEALTEAATHIYEAMKILIKNDFPELHSEFVKEIKVGDVKGMLEDTLRSVRMVTNPNKDFNDVFQDFLNRNNI